MEDAEFVERINLGMGRVFCCVRDVARPATAQRNVNGQIGRNTKLAVKVSTEVNLSGLWNLSIESLYSRLVDLVRIVS